MMPIRNLDALAQDDEKQAAAANRLIEGSLSAESRGFISIVSFAEIVLVMSSNYRAIRTAVADMVEGLLASQYKEPVVGPARQNAARYRPLRLGDPEQRKLSSWVRPNAGRLPTVAMGHLRKARNVVFPRALGMNRLLRRKMELAPGNRDGVCTVTDQVHLNG